MGIERIIAINTIPRLPISGLARLEASARCAWGAGQQTQAPHHQYTQLFCGRECVDTILRSFTARKCAWPSILALGRSGHSPAFPLTGVA